MRLRTKSRRRLATRCRGRPPTSTLATIYGWAASGLLALRASSFNSWGDIARLHDFGGNSEMRGNETLSSSAIRRVPERRAPLPVHRSDAHAHRHPGRYPRRPVRQRRRRPLRGARQPFKWSFEQLRDYTPIVGLPPDSIVRIGIRSWRPRVRDDGLRLVDARASYGIGLETFALGFPIHFDWSWKTLFNKEWEDLRFAAFGGSSAFRQAEVLGVDWIRLLADSQRTSGRSRSSLLTDHAILFTPSIQNFSRRSSLCTRSIETR